MKQFILFLTINLLFSFASFSQFIQTPGGPEGGDIYGLERVGSEIWAASGSGVYKSTNEGVSWTLSGIVNNKKVYNIVAWGDTAIVFYGNSLGTSVTIYQLKTLNAGQTWLPPVAIMTGMNSTDQFLITKIKNAVLIDMWYNHFISSDKGLTWTNYNPPSSDYQSANASDEHTMVNAYINTFTNTKNLYVSTDGSQSWQIVDTSFFVRDIYVDSNLILLSVVTPLNTYQLHRSTDVGETWELIDSFSYNMGFFTKISRDSIYISTSNQSGQFVSYVSYDRGQTWSQMSAPFNCYILDPIDVNGGIIGMISSWGYFGISKIVPSLNLSYYSNSGIKAESCGFVREHNNVLYSEGRRRALRSTDGGNTWNTIQDILLLNSNVYDYYAKGDSLFCLAGGSMYRSFDNGVSWDGFPIGISIGYDILGITHVGNKLYVGTPNDSIFESSDWGLTWTTLSSPKGFVLGYQDSTLFVVTNSGDIHKYDYSSNSWIGPLFSGNTTGAYCGNRLFNLNGVLVYSGSQGRFNISVDGGVTWTTPQKIGIPANLSPRFLSVFNGLWIGSVPGYGFYASSDNGDNWQPLQTGILPFNNYDFAIMNGIIYSGTSFNGVWRSQGTASTITGNVYYDENNNGIKDGNELNIPNKMIVSYPAGYCSVSDYAGSYAMVNPTIGDTVKPVLSNYATHSNPPGVATTGQPFSQDFGVFIPPNISDLSIDMTSSANFQPGFDRYITLFYKNEGTLSQSFTVKFLPDSNTSLVSATTPYTTMNGDTIIWNIASLAVFQNSSIHVVVNISNTVTIGDSLHFNAWIVPQNPDIDTSDNYAEFIPPIVGSYDPNDKSCSAGIKISTEQIADSTEIEYLIRFQNTGNFPTSFVYIEDTINNHLDVSTFRVISFSHPMTYEITGTGYVKFTFDPLELPPVSTNEPESHGFVKYGIYPKKETQEGSGITNTAYIYFDFNPPIVTNTTSTWVVLPEEMTLNIPVQNIYSSEVNWVLYPNPVESVLNIDLIHYKTFKGEILIMDYTGKLMESHSISKANSYINLDKFNNGIYFFLLKAENGKVMASARVIVNH
ncbi:MAG: T9SS type A sorting domain-containing protein [Bacteroidia bacterium]|nr:T9SS type A sorting domain-containing protein [Bacteroidia bacterium]